MNTHRQVAQHIKSVLAKKRGGEPLSDVVRRVSRVIQEILLERSHQESKHGARNAAERARMSKRECFLHYMAILGEEIGEVSNAYLENDPANIRKELIQSAAVIVAMVEYGDQDGWFQHGGAQR